ARLHSQSLDQEPRAQTRAEEALALDTQPTQLVPGGPEMAHRLRGPHQRGQTPTWPQPLPLHGLNRCRYKGANHLLAMLASMFKKPVILPPGRARLATKPEPIGSET